MLLAAKPSLPQIPVHKLAGTMAIDPPPRSELSLQAGHYPVRSSIDAYGNGGFRFASMSHRGSLIALPSGMWAWDAALADDLTLAALARVFDEPRGGEFQFLLLGTGAVQVFPSVDVRRAFLDAGIGLDVMTTGAACRTYNVLLAEGRPVGAAFLAVA
jgi:uncharacterized protein